MHPRPHPHPLSQDGVTGLYKAAQNGHLEVVRLLLDSRADPNRADEVASLLLPLSLRPSLRAHTGRRTRPLHCPLPKRPPARPHLPHPARAAGAASSHTHTHSTAFLSC